MKYIINSKITFDTTEYILTLPHNSNISPIKLSNSAGRILEELIKYRNISTLVTREHLFTIIWKNHGLEPSHGNLNQQVSTIRKAFNSLGLSSSSIITVPKRGLKLNKKLIIDDIQNKSIPQNIIKNQSICNKDHKKNNYELSSSIILEVKTYIKYIITLTITLIFIFGISFLYLYNKTNNIKLYCCKEISSCNICSFSTIPKSQYNNDNNISRY